MPYFFFILVVLTSIQVTLSVDVGRYTQDSGFPRKHLKRAIRYGWPIKTGFVSFGDSYAAGMGTGQTTNDECRVGSNSLGDLLYRWTNDPMIEFQQMACSGDTTNGLDRQINEWKNSSKADLATLSLGGNDVFFTDFVWYCVITPNPLATRNDNRNKCLETQYKATKLLDDEGEGGLKSKLKKAYKRILNKSGRKDFHLYVTGYIEFFNHDEADCDRSTFAFLGPGYYPTSGPWEPPVLLKRNLRRELNGFVHHLNQVIKIAVDETNHEIGRGRVHFVDVNPRYNKHRWYEAGNFHEPSPERRDTWMFLSGWDDVPIEADNSARGFDNTILDEAITAKSHSTVREEYERKVLAEHGKVKLPNLASCNSSLAMDQDPWKRWLCRIAQDVDENPDGRVAQKLKTANEALSLGDPKSRVISSWLPTELIKTFHPRSPGMVAYRDAVIDSIMSAQGGK